MKKTMIKSLTAVLVPMAAMVLMMAFQQETAHAAFYDRSAQDAVVMPADKTLAVPEGQEFKVNFGTSNDYDSYYYFQIKPSKTGTITFTNDYSTGYCVALCNAKKSVVSIGDAGYDDFYAANSSYPYQAVLHYGVKKGATYYIRVKGASSYYADYGQPYVGSVKWTNAKVKASKYGKKKSKAVAIKKKKTVKGLFTAGNKKAQWFKITNKQKNTNITVKSVKNNGGIKFTFYYKSYNHWYNTSRTATRADNVYPMIGTVSKKVKHTYYIKVAPTDKTSGAYTITWK